MTYLVKYEWMNQKHWQSLYHANLNVNLLEENVTQISGGLMVNIDVTVKNIIYVKKILHVVAQMENV